MLILSTVCFIMHTFLTFVSLKVGKPVPAAVFMILMFANLRLIFTLIFNRGL